MATLGFQPSGDSSDVAKKDVISQSLEMVENPQQKVQGAGWDVYCYIYNLISRVLPGLLKIKFFGNIDFDFI